MTTPTEITLVRYSYGLALADVARDETSLSASKDALKATTADLKRHGIEPFELTGSNETERRQQVLHLKLGGTPDTFGDGIGA